MFHLVQGLYAEWNRKEEYSILILGLDNSGKTTFLEALKKIFTPTAKHLPPERITPTVGQNVATIPVDKKTIFKFWDVGGQETLRSLWKEYFHHLHGIVFVVDSTDRKRLEECRDALTQIVTDDEVEGVPILMLANKQDVEDHLEVVDIKELFNPIAEHLGARDSRVLPVSAITQEGVKEAVEWLSVRVVRNKTNRAPKLK